jgi:hypothetical protein
MCCWCIFSFVLTQETSKKYSLLFVRVGHCHLVQQSGLWGTIYILDMIVNSSNRRNNKQLFKSPNSLIVKSGCICYDSWVSSHWGKTIFVLECLHLAVQWTWQNYEHIEHCTLCLLCHVLLPRIFYFESCLFV